MKNLVSILTNWKHWPFYVFYAPLLPAWVGYYIKSRSLWFFSSSNPTITFGGFQGETKSEIYKQLPSSLIPETLFISPKEDFNNVQQKLSASSIVFPFVVKPDVGLKGYLFRIVDTTEQLQQYHNTIKSDYLIQQLLTMPIEISVFYIRMPWKKTGEITAIIQKELSHVTGDGKSTLQQLIEANKEINDVREKLLKKFSDRLHEVLPAGEKFILSYIANIPNGAMFTDVTHLANDKISAFFDGLSLPAQFCYGRYDIKCNSLDDFLNLHNIYLLEFNGSGSVPNHVFAGKFTIPQAYKEIKRHWKALYEISKYYNKNGYPYWSFLRGTKFVRSSYNGIKSMKKINNELHW